MDIEWIDVTTFGQPSYVPGPMRCPTNKLHDVEAASNELSWPTALTDEDRTWLRQQLQLAKEKT